MSTRRGTLFIFALLLCVSLPFITSQKNPHFIEGRSTIVHLFEWKWSDIAQECEGFLRDKGFGGVQTSPPNEYLVIENRPWWERYQPVSYQLNTRSGDETAFADMVRRCNAAGVRIYIDAVINHMSAGSGTGTAGSTADRENKNFPAVPYQYQDFHESCDLSDFNDPNNVRNCEMANLADLDQSRENVRQSIADYFNHLIDLGVAGFRVDAAKHIWPEDLEEIYSRLNDLSTDHGFPPNSRAYPYQEVPDYGLDAVSKEEYTGFGAVLEFVYGKSLGAIFQHGNTLSALENWGPGNWFFAKSEDAVAFIDNHDNQRTGEEGILTYKNDKLYKMAIAFMQAHPYGTTRIMSSYFFDEYSQGPPHDDNFNIMSPNFNEDNTCGNGWVCEHRWREIYAMVGFRNAVQNTQIENWWTNFDNQIAFSRGDKGFIVFTNGGDIDEKLHTGLPAGTYCDVISGDLINGQCTGKTVAVDSNGDAQISLAENEMDGVMAIHVNAKL